MPTPTQPAAEKSQENQTPTELLRRITLLLSLVGDQSICKGCGAGIWWVQHRNGKRAPYTSEGLNHFIDCPQAQRFKKARA